MRAVVPNAPSEPDAMSIPGVLAGIEGRERFSKRLTHYHSWT